MSVQLPLQRFDLVSGTFSFLEQLLFVRKSKFLQNNAK